MLINAVFEGGGMKAIAIAGAISVAEQQKFQFHQVAGTSSGAIIAALLAAGYTAKEIQNLVVSTPFTSFLKRAPLFQIKVIGPAVRLLLKKGLYSGEALEYWIAEKLAAKGLRTFGELKPQKLRIIASDISQGKLLVLPNDIAQFGIDPDRFTISKAVRMSTSIPYFFDPVIIRQASPTQTKSKNFSSNFIYIVDGGLLSNFPLWLFDQHNIGSKPMPDLPTIGFQLVGKDEQTARKINGPFSMFEALFAMMMDARDQRFIEDHNRFRTIKIPTLGVRTTQFDLKPELSRKLYESGVNSAKKFFDRWTLEEYAKQYKQLLV